MFLKIVIYRNVAFTHANTQKDITELKQIHAICLGKGFQLFSFKYPNKMMDITHVVISLHSKSFTLIGRPN